MISEKFLLDANIFVTPYKTYYPMDLAPGFWKQLRNMILEESVKILDIVKAEVSEGGDELTEWLNSVNGLETLDRRDQSIIANYTNVLSYIQNSPHYDDRALRAWSDAKIADPWLIATAATKGYTIVTNEQGAGKLTGKSKNPKIPDVAHEFGVKCVDIFYFMRSMSIKWM